MITMVNPLEGHVDEVDSALNTRRLQATVIERVDLGMAVENLEHALLGRLHTSARARPDPTVSTNSWRMRADMTTDDHATHCSLTAALPWSAAMDVFCPIPELDNDSAKNTRIIISRFVSPFRAR